MNEKRFPEHNTELFAFSDIPNGQAKAKIQIGFPQRLIWRERGGGVHDSQLPVLPQERKKLWGDVVGFLIELFKQIDHQLAL